MEMQNPPPGGRLRTLLRELPRHEAAGGLALMSAAVLALVVANSPLAIYYQALLAMPIKIGVGEFAIDKHLIRWINDGLMVIFFFLIGMELKREVLEGHLSTPRKASLPAIAALGVMVGPAGIYLAFNGGDLEAARGWAIPTATDIAFALGALSLLGKRVPPALKVFLLSIAIFDDLGAIVLIATFYTSELSGTALAIAAVFAVGLIVLNRMGIMTACPYLILGFLLWLAVLKSGVHATLSGVVLAMAIPLRVRKANCWVFHPLGITPQTELLPKIAHALQPWVAFLVLPIFAFANAGVSIAGLAPQDTLHSVSLGIVCGLFFGKQIGVLLSCWLAVRFRVAALPDGINWRELHGLTMLCGIGFTMSIFISTLAFAEGHTSYGGLDRLGILSGSLLSGLLGCAVIRASLNRRSAELR